MIPALLSALLIVALLFRPTNKINWKKINKDEQEILNLIDDSIAYRNISPEEEVSGKLDMTKTETLKELDDLKNKLNKINITEYKRLSKKTNILISRLEKFIIKSSEIKDDQKGLKKFDYKIISLRSKTRNDWKIIEKVREKNSKPKKIKTKDLYK